MPKKNKKIVAGSLPADLQISAQNDERTIAHHEASFRGFIENLPVMFYAVDPRPPFAPFYVSPDFASLGYPVEEWLNTPDMWLKLIHPDDSEDVLAKTEMAMLLGTENDYEYRIVKRDGEVRWVRDRGCFVRDERGKLVYWQGIILDVTEHKNALEALEESEGRYRALFENANDLIYVHDLEGNYIAINQAAQRAFGYTREEALKLNMSEVVAPDHLKLARRMLSEKISARSKQTSYEIDCFNKKGERITLEVNTSIIYKNDLPVAVQGIGRDITERKITENALRESEERYRDLFENANDLIYTHDLEGNFTSLNRAGEIITGYTREEALERNIAQVVAPEFMEKARRMTMRKLTGEAPTSYELEIIAKNGQRILIDLSTRLIFQNGAPVAVQGIGRDITARRKAEEDLKESERRYRYLGEGIMHQVWTAQPDGKLDYVNQRTAEYFGRTVEHLLGEGWQDVIHPEDLPECIDRWTHSLETGDYYEVEFRLLRKDGKFRWHLARANAGYDADGKIVKWFGTNTDIHDQKNAEAKLNHFAKHDALTNLANRSEFMNQLQASAKQAELDPAFRFAVLFLDLDRFKLVNDSLGHAIGDKLLVAIAEKLRSCIRGCDVVARLGGDEFTVLLNRIGEQADVLRVAERIQDSFAKPFKIDSYEIFASASIGVIVSDELARAPEDFLRDADTAMYRAKETGKARYEVFDREMHVRNMNLLRVENDLRRAVERGEFRVFYQPIVNLETGEISEFEALIRWQHPEHGLVPPAEFIGVAEETGLIIPIGRWILEESCRQARKWQKRFSLSDRLTVSVNLSAKQLMHPSLVAQVREILTATGLTARCLNLEVTETMVMEHSETALDVLNELKKLGVSLSTDDFGTGYSSLSYLHRFPFERLKIDRSFVGKMDSDAKSEEIIRTILTLAENLNLETVAEGIENKHQLSRLRALGCRFGQGYLISKPVEAAQAEKLLRRGLNNDVFSDAPENPFNFEPDAIIELAKIQ